MLQSHAGSEAGVERSKGYPPSQLAKLRLEQLESRDVPTALTWLGNTPGDVMSQFNWWDFQYGNYATPAANDDLYFVGPQPAGDYTYLGESDRIACEGRMEFGATYTYDVVTVGVPINTVFLPFRARGGFNGANLPLVAGYAVTFNTAPGQDPTIQIKKN